MKCPVYKYKIKNFDEIINKTTKIDDYCKTIVSEVITFLSDQSEKKKWLQDYISEKSSSDKTSEKIMLSFCKQMSNDVNISLESVVRRIADWEVEELTNIERSKKLEKWLTNRCHLSAHAEILKYGMKRLNIRPLKTGQFRRNISGRLNRMNNFVIITNEVRTSEKGYITIQNVKSSIRFKLHGKFQNTHDLCSFSTGPSNVRDFHVVSITFWDSVFPVVLPTDVIKNNILPRIANVAEESSKKSNNKSNRFNYYYRDDSCDDEEYY